MLPVRPVDEAPCIEFTNKRPESATQKVKETAGMSSGQMKGKAEELTGEAKGKAQEVSGEAKGKASELEGKAKAKMQ